MYIPLHCHSHYSLLDGLSKPSDIIARLAELDLPACAVTDHGSIAGTIKFHQAMREVDKKPILGIEMYICNQDPKIKTSENRKLYHQLILAKNLKGWQQLIKLVSSANHPDHFYYKPRLDIPRLIDFCHDGNLISISGHLGSWLASTLQENDYDIEETSKMAILLQDMFGKGNFYIEIQLVDQANNPECLKIANALREVSRRTGVPRVATPDAHYCTKEDVLDHRILLCTNMKTTFARIANDKNFPLKTFFESNNFHIPSSQEMMELHKDYPEELQNTIELAEQCENYDVTARPSLPIFQCPDNLTPDQYLRERCRKGWIDKKFKDNQEYIDRVKYELSTLQDAGLSSYFLIVADILDYVKANNWLPGPGRGSAAGCLVSYLIGITSIDPIKHGLLFERFYNAGRNTKDKVALPDIDVDVPPSKRDLVINYIKNKYGQDKVAQIITFGMMKGRSALTDVLRAHGTVNFNEMKEITKHIPDEAKIADKLQDMKAERGYSSIIQWSLEHRTNKLKDWCYIDEEKQLQGPLSRSFAQAIRLERTLAVQGRHPAGVIVSEYELAPLCPMTYDTKSKQQIVGWDMEDAEAVGLVKLDILGVSVLDKIMGVASILKTGKIDHEDNL